MSKKTVNIRVYEKTRDKLKVKAAKLKRPMIELVELLAEVKADKINY